MSRWYTIIGLLLFLVACKPGIPGKYIQPDDMEDILVDYHLARAMGDRLTNHTDSVHYMQEVYIESVLKKHGVTKAEFDSSLVYYYTRADRFEEICKRVAERLEEQALVMGVSEGEIGKYASLDATGDTANVWSDRPIVLLSPVPPYNHRGFEVMVDTTFQQDDSFLFQFMSDYLYQDGIRTAVAYVVFQYSDTTITRNLRIQSAGLNQLRIPEHHADLQGIKGFFFAGDGSERTSTVRMMFLTNIQLIRFHKETDEEESQTNSIPSDSIAGRLDEETLSGGDPGGRSIKFLPADPGVGEHRMDERTIEPEIR